MKKLTNRQLKVLKGGFSGDVPCVGGNGANCRKLPCCIGFDCVKYSALEFRCQRLPL